MNDQQNPGPRNPGGGSGQGGSGQGGSGQGGSGQGGSGPRGPGQGPRGGGGRGPSRGGRGDQSGRPNRGGDRPPGGGGGNPRNRSGGGGRPHGGPPGQHGGRSHGGGQGGYGAPRDGQEAQARERSLREVWPNYLADGYFDGSGVIRLDLVSQKTIVPFVRTLVKESTPRLSQTQFRRFFHSCRTIEAALRAKRGTWDEARARLQSIGAAAADAYGSKRIPKLLQEFLTANLERISTEKEFLGGFMRHFEAVLGFSGPFFSDRSER